MKLNVSDINVFRAVYYTFKHKISDPIILQKLKIYFWFTLI